MRHWVVYLLIGKLYKNLFLDWKTGFQSLVASQFTFRPRLFQRCQTNRSARLRTADLTAQLSKEQLINRSADLRTAD
jgi:hypothetical protein